MTPSIKEEWLQAFLPFTLYADTWKPTWEHPSNLSLFLSGKTKFSIYSSIFINILTFGPRYTGFVYWGCWMFKVKFKDLSFLCVYKVYILLPCQLQCVFQETQQLRLQVWVVWLHQRLCTRENTMVFAFTFLESWGKFCMK